MYSKDRALSIIEKHKLPKVFENLIGGKDVHDEIEFLFSCPSELYLSTESEQKELIPKNYEPLWSDKNFDSIYCYLEEGDSIHKVYIEGGEMIFNSYTHFAASVIKILWEQDEIDVLEEVSEVLEFKYLKKAVEYMEKYNNKISREEYEKEFYRLFDKPLSNELS